MNTRLHRLVNNILTIPPVKECFLVSYLVLFFTDFMSLPLVWLSSHTAECGISLSLLYLFTNIAYVSIMSPRHLLNFKVGKFKYFRRLLSLRPTNFVALLYLASSIWAICIHDRPTSLVCDKNYENLSKFIDVTAKILSVLFSGHGVRKSFVCWNKKVR